jgi:hypothetical protein
LRYLSAERDLELLPTLPGRAGGVLEQASRHPCSRHDFSPVGPKNAPSDGKGRRLSISCIRRLRTIFVYHLSSRRIGWRITQGDCNPCEVRSNYHGIRGIINMLPVDRALAIYGTIANRSELQGTRDRLSQHLWKVFMEGEHDPLA